MNDYLKNEKWAVRSDAGFIIGVASNSTRIGKCDFLLKKGSFKSLTEHALSVTIPVENFKIIGFEKSLDCLFAIAILLMRRDGNLISEDTISRIKDISKSKNQEMALAIWSYILKPGIDFNTRLTRAKLWLRVGITSDGRCLNKSTELSDGGLARLTVDAFKKQVDDISCNSAIYGTPKYVSAR